MMNPKNGLIPGEFAWEVMQQSDSQGEIPVRLIINTHYIRTATSLFLTIPEEVKEYWRVQANEIVKVAWCPQLCVLSILYHLKGEDKENVKVFLTNHFVANKFMKTYKKIKPVAVHLSPARPFISKKTDPVPVSVSFKIADGLPNEKFWRVIHYMDEFTAKEMFLGLNAGGIRLVDPMTRQVRIVIESIDVLLFGHFVMFGGTVIKIKYMDGDLKNNKPKRKKIILDVHPLVGKDIMSHYEFCSTHGDDYQQIKEFPKFKVPLDEAQDRGTGQPEHPKMLRCLSDGNIQPPEKTDSPVVVKKKREDKRKSQNASAQQKLLLPPTSSKTSEKATPKGPLSKSALLPQKSQTPNSRKIIVDVSSENKENINPILINAKGNAKGAILKNNEAMQNCSNNLQLRFDSTKNTLQVPKSNINITKL